MIAPHSLALGRWLLAALILGCFCRAELWRERRWLWAHKSQFVLLGALGMWICGAWVYLAARTTTATNIALIYSVSPVLIALLSVWWLRERFGRWQMLGVAIALSGVIHIVIKGHWAALAQVVWVAGDLWMVAATLAWAAFVVLQRRWPSPLSAAAYLSAAALGGVLVLAPFTLWELSQAHSPGLSAHGLALVALAALCPGVGAYWAYSHVQRTLGVARASAQLYLGPLYGALMAWAVLGEPVGAHHALGAVLILPGIWLVSQRPRDS